MMDATNRYVMMCQKAEDIQSLWKPKQCDFIINLTDLEEGISFCRPAESIVQVVNMYYSEQDGEQYSRECEDLKEQALWLPRQDQLQRIIEPENARVYSFMSEVMGSQYYDYSKNTMVIAPELFYSMEQLWLGYVMKRQFQKGWNETDWILLTRQL
jgi:hypothetical protein